MFNDTIARRLVELENIRKRNKIYKDFIGRIIDESEQGHNGLSYYDANCFIDSNYIYAINKLERVGFRIDKEPYVCIRIYW
jgi:hypothetical protein